MTIEKNTTFTKNNTKGRSLKCLKRQVFHSLTPEKSKIELFNTFFLEVAKQLLMGTPGATGPTGLGDIYFSSLKET